MAKYNVKFDDSQAAVLRNAALRLDNMAEQNTIHFELIRCRNWLANMGEAHMTPIVAALDAKIRRVDLASDHLKQEAAALVSIMAEYKRAERATQTNIGENAEVKRALAFFAGFWQNVLDWFSKLIPRKTDNSGTSDTTNNDGTGNNATPISGGDTGKAFPNNTAGVSFNQKDYSQFVNSNGGVKSNKGCGLTSAAYALTAMGISVTPLQAYERSYGNTITYWDRVADGAAYQSDVEKSLTADSLAAKVIAANLNPNKSPVILQFSYPHYMVVKDAIRQADGSWSFVIFDPNGGIEVNKSFGNFGYGSLTAAFCYTRK